MILVVDASAVIAALIGSDAVADAVRREIGSATTLAAPHLVDIETTNVLRRLEPGDPSGTAAAVEALAALPIDRYPHFPLIPRVWDLRNNLSAYDALYVALAEALDAPLLTLDRRIARGPHRVRLVDLGG